MEKMTKKKKIVMIVGLALVALAIILSIVLGVQKFGGAEEKRIKKAIDIQKNLAMKLTEVCIEDNEEREALLKKIRSFKVKSIKLKEDADKFKKYTVTYEKNNKIVKGNEKPEAVTRDVTVTFYKSKDGKKLNLEASALGTILL